MRSCTASGCQKPHPPDPAHAPRDSPPIGSGLAPAGAGRVFIAVRRVGAERTIGGMTSPYWPLSGLRLRTPDLELRWPAPADLDALAGLAAEGVHDAGVQPFTVPWTDAPPAGRARAVLQYHWSQWGSWQPTDWTLDLVAERAGTIVGSQGLSGADFAVRREVSTGSWVGRRFQGQGIGTQMRAAVLHLAFEGLDAQSRDLGRLPGQPGITGGVLQARLRR